MPQYMEPLPTVLQVLVWPAFMLLFGLVGGVLYALAGWARKG
jgi:hypothetical protein